MESLEYQIVGEINLIVDRLNTIQRALTKVPGYHNMSKFELSGEFRELSSQFLRLERLADDYF